MVHTLGNYASHMIVGKGVKHRFALSPELYKLTVFQDPELV